MIHRLLLEHNKEQKKYRVHVIYRFDTISLQLQMCIWQIIAHLIAAIVVESFIETLRKERKRKIERILQTPNKNSVTSVCEREEKSTVEKKCIFFCFNRNLIIKQNRMQLKFLKRTIASGYTPSFSIQI